MLSVSCIQNTVLIQAANVKNVLFDSPEMVPEVKMPAVKPDDQSSTPGPTWYRERTISCKLNSDLCTLTMEYIPPYIKQRNEDRMKMKKAFCNLSYYNELSMISTYVFCSSVCFGGILHPEGIK